MKDILLNLNKIIHQYKWFDFELDSINKSNLVILGSTDFSYYHELEIVFEDLHFIQCPRNWSVDTTKEVFTMPNMTELKKINIGYELEVGYELLKIVTENNSPIYISARNITYLHKKIEYEWPK